MIPYIVAAVVGICLVWVDVYPRIRLAPVLIVWATIGAVTWYAWDDFVALLGFGAVMTWPLAVTAALVWGTLVLWLMRPRQPAPPAPPTDDTPGTYPHNFVSPDPPPTRKPRTQYRVVTGHTRRRYR